MAFSKPCQTVIVLQTGGKMKLQTQVEIKRTDLVVDYHTRMMMLGSCFAENIGSRFQYYRFPVDINPCGIVYNPLSVAAVLRLLTNNKRFTESDLLMNEEKWVSLLHHGSFSSPHKELCLKGINDRLEQAAGRLHHTDLLIITWGTAWVYRYKATGAVVANCHKFPVTAFERSRLSIAEIVSEYTELISALREVRPGVKVLFTVSPIRHWKDGANGNQLSKATLLLAIDELCRQLSGVYYFPSYEIVMDELRDYRFYAEDMLHVSDVAVDYIWERFRESCISPDTERLMKRVEKVNKTLAHRPSDENDPAWCTLYAQAQCELEEIKRMTDTGY